MPFWRIYAKIKLLIMSSPETQQMPRIPHPAEATLLESRAAVREEKVRQLLGTDYEYARDSGLLDIFHYDPETGEDGLMHVLSGEVVQSPDGFIVARGFHHEPSARLMQEGLDIREEHKTKDITPPVDELPSKLRRDFRRGDFEPYKAYVQIKGRKKLDLASLERGDDDPHLSASGMFPEEYDPLTVLQTIKIARDNRDITKDKIGHLPHHRRIGNYEARAPLLNADPTKSMDEILADPRTSMKIRLIMDKEGKIISAYPAQKGGKIGMSDAEIRQGLGLDPSPATPEQAEEARIILQEAGGFVLDLTDKSGDK